MKIEWRTQAFTELSAILEHISGESASGAARVRAQIFHSVSFLADWPEIGRKGRGKYRELVIPHTPYVVLFVRTKETVTIVRVLHASRRR
jgi:plasmid stabilization system protein ParE